MTIVNNVLMGAEVMVSILLIVVVVLQSSKSSGMGAVSGAADSSFGGKERGLDGLLSRLTVILGVIFAVLSLVLGAFMHQY